MSTLVLFLFFSPVVKKFCACLFLDPEIEKERERERERERECERETDRQTDRQTKRQRHRERDRDRDKERCYPSLARKYNGLDISLVVIGQSRYVAQ